MMYDQETVDILRAAAFAAGYNSALNDTAHFRPGGTVSAFVPEGQRENAQRHGFTMKAEDWRT